MSDPVGATNQPGSSSQNASAADGQVPGSSASVHRPPAYFAPIDDYEDVCIFISKVRTDSTITHHIGLSDGADWKTDLGECEDSPGEYCQTALKLSPCLPDT